MIAREFCLPPIAQRRRPEQREPELLLEERLGRWGERDFAAARHAEQFGAMLHILHIPQLEEAVHASPGKLEWRCTPRIQHLPAAAFHDVKLFAEPFHFRLISLGLARDEHIVCWERTAEAVHHA